MMKILAFLTLTFVAIIALLYFLVTAIENEHDRMQAVCSTYTCPEPSKPTFLFNEEIYRCVCAPPEGVYP
jgi:hypothetical protein